MLHTKKDFQDCLMHIINPLQKYYTEGCGGIKCGASGVNYGEQVARMEGFARVLWGLAPFWGGQGEHETFEEIYIKGIASGVDPEHAEYWGKIGDFDQRMVETAALGLALILAPHKIWDPLSDEQKKNLYTWLDMVNEATGPDNNWQFFAVLVNLGFKNIGMPYNKKVMENALEKIDSYYHGNGWYADGKTTQFDYYIAFAMHFYGLIYAKVMEKEDAERSKVFRERAMLFAQDFIYWFAEDGSALVFGRSLTYRFAQCCFWSACVFAGIEPFQVGIMKGIIVRNLEWWLNKTVFDNDGVLTIGYAYPNLCMSEGYNGFGSPYWALKTFLILALDDEHAFFKVEALPLPELDKLHVIKTGHMVVQRVKGHAVAITAGQWAPWRPIHVAEKYAKFVYSTKYGYCVPRSYYGIDSAGTDNMLAFVKEDMCFVRRQCEEIRIEENGTVYSKWSPYAGITVETTIIPTENGHIRRHTVTCTEECEAYDCSFAIPKDEVATDNAGVNNSTADTASINCTCGRGENVTIKCKPNTNLIKQETVLPAVKYRFSKGTHRVESVITY